VRGELARASLKAEYIAVLDPDTFTPLSTVERPALIALAAPVGPVRLIDNLEVTP
jgi:pantoate--beta-alanine ligase